MIAIRKLMSLSPGHRARKAAQSLQSIELAYRRGDFSGASWVQELVVALATDAGQPGSLRKLLDAFMPASGPDPWGVVQPVVPGTGSSLVSPRLTDPLEGIRSVNKLRRSLEALSGGAPADWDFLSPLGSNLDAGVRSVFPGMRAYFEDIRSPFNVGSMIRTADAFGLAEILLSGFCADPAHPRAQRSAMGASSILPWRRATLDGLDNLGEVFALELGGYPIDEFEFPEHGVVLLGSEELGVSPEALACCTRRVSIPMFGAKGSLNVGVAFGVLLAAWSRNLQSRGIQALPLAQAD